MLTRNSTNIEADHFAGFSTNIRIIGMDLTGETFTSHVRNYKGETGTPAAVITMAFVSAENMTYQQMVTNGWPIPANAVLTDTADVSTLSMLISKTDVGDLAGNANTAGKDRIYYWDVKINNTHTDVLTGGTFTLKEGVTP